MKMALRVLVFVAAVGAGMEQLNLPIPPTPVPGINLPIPPTPVPGA